MSVEIGGIGGGVTAPRAFRASGVACGIKASGAPDLALIVAGEPGAAAGVFTTNRAQAAQSASELRTRMVKDLMAKESAATDAKTARLKALRLAKEAEDAAAAPAAKKTRKSR